MRNVTHFSGDGATREALDRWYRTSHNGHRLQQQLEKELRVRLEGRFGYHMVILGTEGGMPLMDCARVQQVITSSPAVPEVSSTSLHVLADDEALPFESESVDVVVALHALDISRQPHQVLREIHRILTPQGHLLLAGLNPRSFLGVWRRLHGWLRRSRWRDLGFLSISKITDWLTLLDFASAPASHKLAMPTLGEGRAAKRIQQLDDWWVNHNLPGGSVYVIEASKRVTGSIHGPAVRRHATRIMPISVARPVAGRGRLVQVANPDGSEQSR